MAPVVVETAKTTAEQQIAQAVVQQVASVQASFQSNPLTVGPQGPTEAKPTVEPKGDAPQSNPNTAATSGGSSGSIDIVASVTQAATEQPSTPPPAPPVTTFLVGTVQVVPITTTDSAPLVMQTGPQAPSPEVNVAADKTSTEVNLAPEITSPAATGTVTEHGTTSVAGDIAFSDGNAADTHTASLKLVSAVWIKADDTTQPLPGDVATFTATLSGKMIPGATRRRKRTSSSWRPARRWSSSTK
jgi:hypothetical protein